MNTTKNGTSFKSISDDNSKVLILWTSPWKKSLENWFYYVDPRNQFWKIVWDIYGENYLHEKTKAEKERFLLKNWIALWDIWETYKNYWWWSSDKGKKWWSFNKIKELVKKSNIKYIIVHSTKAEKGFKKYLKKEKWDFSSYYYLPSPSWANTSKTLEEKKSIWKKKFKELWLI